MAIDAVTRMNDRTPQEDRKKSIRLRFHSPRRGEGRSMPAPRRIVSVRTEEENRARGGDLIRIVGKNLQFDPRDSRSGVFFVDYGETRSAHYDHISSDLIIARVPDSLSAGPYLLRLRCASGEVDYRSLSGSAVFVVE